MGQTATLGCESLTRTRRRDQSGRCGGAARKAAQEKLNAATASEAAADARIVALKAELDRLEAMEAEEEAAEERAYAEEVTALEQW